ncbi:MAG: hypothetical protein LBG70_04510, partial [Bifidobacteriaceae bacterium]|nr:hypothetical protein [Bifidobacteriaceae bacterium]
IYDDGDFNLLEATVLDIQSAMAAGKISAVQLTKAYLGRIAAYDHARFQGQAGTELDSIISVNPQAIDIAAALDAERAAYGPRGMLHGIPVIVKDNYNTIDMPTTIGSKVFQNNYTGVDAFMVERLRAAGAIILAKANLAEFAFNVDGISALARTTNAYLPGATSGGSSAGTGASISANFGVIGLGTDTGGSIRYPSAYNSLVGVRPTVGLLSREGIAPLALSQDTGGPITRTVVDAALALDVMAGTDSADPATAGTDALLPADSYLAGLSLDGLTGARIGYVTNEGRNQHIGNNVGIRRIYDEAKSTISSLGATLVDITEIQLASETSGSTREFAHDLDQYLDKYVKVPGVAKTAAEIVTAWQADNSVAVRGSTVQQRLQYNTAEQYADWMEQHNAEIQQNRDTLDEIMRVNDLDAIILPSVLSFAVGSGSGYSNNRVSALSGFPSVSVPSGYASQADVAAGLNAAALGGSTTVEFIGPRFSEADLLKYAYAFEQATKVRQAPTRFPETTWTRPPAISGSAVPTFKVSTSPAQPTSSSSVTVTAQAAGLSDAYAYQLQFTYDPTALRYIDFSAQASDSAYVKVWDDQGTITVFHSKLGSSPATAGTVDLVDLQFEALSPGNTRLTLASVERVSTAGYTVSLLRGSPISKDLVVQSPVTPSPSDLPTESTPSPTDDPTDSTPSPSLDTSTIASPSPSDEPSTSSPTPSLSATDTPPASQSATPTPSQSSPPPPSQSVTSAAPVSSLTATPSTSPSVALSPKSGSIRSLRSVAKTIRLVKGHSVKVPIAAYGDGLAVKATVKSSRTKVASVSKLPLVTPGSVVWAKVKAKRTGTTKLVFTVGGKTTTLNIKVVTKPVAAKSLKVTKAKSLAPNSTARLKVTVKPAGATNLPKWRSLNQSVAKI